MALSVREIERVLDVIGAAGWDEADVVIGDVRLTVSRAAAGVGAAGAAAQAVRVVRSPSVGVVRRGPLEVGQAVEANQALGRVETWKSAHEVTSEAGGVVAAIHAQSGDTVEFGQALLTVVPGAA